MQHLLVIIVLFLAIPSYAETEKSSSEVSTESISCKDPDSIPSEHFKKLQDRSSAVSLALCRTLLLPESRKTSDIQDELLFQYSIEVKTTAENGFRKYGFKNLNRPFDSFSSIVVEGSFESKKLPDFNVEAISQTSLLNDTVIFYFHEKRKRGSFPLAKDDDCKPDYDGDTCFAALADFALAVNPYKYLYKSMTASETQGKLKTLSKRWDNYLDSARSQTALDILLTTMIEHRHFKKGYLVGPPSRQWTLLHPSLVYEHINSAPDGENNQISIAIEWLGVNWWDKKRSLLPFAVGASIATTYSDRLEVKDVGHGIMLHFDNQYSIGWANHDGEDGFYIALDMFKLIKNKKERFDYYKEKM